MGENFSSCGDVNRSSFQPINIMSIQPQMSMFQSKENDIIETTEPGPELEIQVPEIMSTEPGLELEIQGPDIESRNIDTELSFYHEKVLDYDVRYYAKDDYISTKIVVIGEYDINNPAEKGEIEKFIYKIEDSQSRMHLQKLMHIDEWSYSNISQLIEETPDGRETFLAFGWTKDIGNNYVEITIHLREIHS